MYVNSTKHATFHIFNFVVTHTTLRYPEMVIHITRHTESISCCHITRTLSSHSFFTKLSYNLWIKYMYNILSWSSNRDDIQLLKGIFLQLSISLCYWQLLSLGSDLSNFKQVIWTKLLNHKCKTAWKILFLSQEWPTSWMLNLNTSGCTYNMVTGMTNCMEKGQ